MEAFKDNRVRKEPQKKSIYDLKMWFFGKEKNNQKALHCSTTKVSKKKPLKKEGKKKEDRQSLTWIGNDDGSNRKEETKKLFLWSDDFSAFF